LLYPGVYYVVFPAPRYRVPIEPEMAILAVFLLAEATPIHIRMRRSTPSAAPNHVGSDAFVRADHTREGG
jgi:hypothetical protein